MKLMIEKREERQQKQNSNSKLNNYYMWLNLDQMINGLPSESIMKLNAEFTRLIYVEQCSVNFKK